MFKCPVRVVLFYLVLGLSVGYQLRQFGFDLF